MKLITDYKTALPNITPVVAGTDLPNDGQVIAQSLRPPQVTIIMRLAPLHFEQAGGRQRSARYKGT